MSVQDEAELSESDVCLSSRIFRIAVGYCCDLVCIILVGFSKQIHDRRKKE